MDFPEDGAAGPSHGNGDVQFRVYIPGESGETNRKPWLQQGMYKGVGECDG